MMNQDGLPGFNLEAALNGLGLSLYTDEWAAKVLAFMHCLGGTSTVVVKNETLKFAIDCSFNKLYPNQRLNAAVLDLMQQYIKELKEQGLNTPWLHEIGKRYNIKDLPGLWERAGW